MKIAASVAVLSTCLVLALGGTALAQANPTQDAYSGTAGQTVEQVGGNAGTPSPAPSSSATVGVLPFTGLQLLLIGVAGSVLIGTGLVLRRSVRPPSE
jgi:hypothetical protein